MRFRLIQSGLTSILMVTFVTAWVTFLNLGFTELYFRQWGKAFLLAWPVAYLIAFLVGPRVAKITQRINGYLTK